MKILLAVDGSTCSDRAVAEAARLPWPAGSEVKVLNVIGVPIVPGVEPWALPPTYFEDLDKESMKGAQAVVDRAVSKLKEREDILLKVTSEIVQGSPKSAILEVSDGWGADLIVVGSHGYGAWYRLLLGSVSHAIALHAKCSVEIVRCREAHVESAKEPGS
jgi:nucleotide-binding universal stress UspA family protein